MIRKTSRRWKNIEAKGRSCGVRLRPADPDTPRPQRAGAFPKAFRERAFRRGGLRIGGEAQRVELSRRPAFRNPLGRRGIGGSSFFRGAAQDGACPPGNRARPCCRGGCRRHGSWGRNRAADGTCGPEISRIRWGKRHRWRPAANVQFFAAQRVFIISRHPAPPKECLIAAQIHVSGMS